MYTTQIIHEVRSFYFTYRSRLLAQGYCRDINGKMSTQFNGMFLYIHEERKSKNRDKKKEAPMLFIVFYLYG